MRQGIDATVAATATQAQQHHDLLWRVAFSAGAGDGSDIKLRQNAIRSVTYPKVLYSVASNFFNENEWDIP
jgi:hypothetical protein